MNDTPFYTSISSYYDQIFPLNQAQIHFVNKFLSGCEDAEVLDIGCGSGSLALALSQQNTRVQAIDFDPEMIALAEIKKKKAAFDLLPEFHQMDMLQIDQHFEEGQFDAVLCFGNTLVHLSSMETIGSFIHSVAKVLKPGGRALFQLLHYENILNKLIDTLPIIENEAIRFERHYRFSGSPKIMFQTKLVIKSTGQEVNNSIPLFAINKQELTSLLIQTGLKDISFFGNFKGDPLQANSIPLVLSCIK